MSFWLKKNQFKSFCEWYRVQKGPPTYHQVLNRAYQKAIEKAGPKVQTAEGIDEKRYYYSSNSIDNYYGMLEEFFLLHIIPSPFVYNVDEEGHDEYTDTKQIDQLVFTQEDISKLFYPIERKSDHTTFVASIGVDGTYLKQLIVVKRKQ